MRQSTDRPEAHTRSAGILNSSLSLNPASPSSRVHCHRRIPSPPPALLLGLQCPSLEPPPDSSHSAPIFLKLGCVGSAPHRNPNRLILSGDNARDLLRVTRGPFTTAALLAGHSALSRPRSFKCVAAGPGSIPHPQALALMPRPPSLYALLHPASRRLSLAAVTARLQLAIVIDRRSKSVRHVSLGDPSPEDSPEDKA